MFMLITDNFIQGVHFTVRKQVNQQRDTYASYLGYFDIINESKARITFTIVNFTEKLVQPCKPTPEKIED
uniref:Uncharacterized protein n=1 Tax=Tetranychus urticae TaxID=32264 RepID=T1KVR4_TETUR